jgi:outer membrane protein TolC
MLTSSSTGPSKFVTRTKMATAALALCSMSLTSIAQVAPPSAPAPAAAAPTATVNFAAPAPFHLTLPHSHNPFSAYAPSSLPDPSLINSPRLDQCIKDGKLYLSLEDAVALALENNLDLAIARYNLPIAETDMLRTRAGGTTLGVNTGLVQNTPGGTAGVSAGSGAGGTSVGAGGAGAGAGGLVQSTFGEGTPISSYDPQIVAVASTQHSTQQEANTVNYGVPLLKQNTTIVNAGVTQAFSTGTAIQFNFNNQRDTINSPYQNLNPAIFANWRFLVSQQLLAGFGFGPNRRYIRISKNNRKISDVAFKNQVASTITQIANIYWDFVNAYIDEEVKERSLTFAQKSLDDQRKQLELQAVPEMDVMKAEAEVAVRDQDLTVSRTNLELQASLVKNALTKRLDPTLEEMPVVPTAILETMKLEVLPPVQDLVAAAFRDRTDLYETQVTLDNFQISRKALRNQLLPTVTLIGYYSGSGLAGQPNPNYSLGDNPVNVPSGYGGALSSAFNGTAPDYLAELQIAIPLRNRLAKADQFRSELEYKQTELLVEQQKKNIRIEVRNADYALEQTAARVASARKARDLAQRTFDITKQEQTLGAGSSFQTLSAERDLAVADSTLAQAEATYEKSRLQLYRVTGQTLDRFGISIAEALDGVVTHIPVPLQSAPAIVKP